MRRSRAALAAAALLLPALALTGCGTTQPASTPSAAADRVAVMDGSGARVTLDGPAKRVVATEWNAVETLQSLGVTPVGVADTKGYAQYDTVEPLPSGVKDVGGRGEPSVDSVASLKPDLVVVPSEYEDSVIAQLKRVAPVLVLTSGDAEKPVEQMRANVELLAEVTGRQDEAATQLKDFDAALATAKQRLESAGLGGAEVAIADAYSQGDQVTVRPYTEGSLLGGAAEAIGLKDAWMIKGDAAYGLGTTDVEGVTGLGGARFVELVNAQDGDPFAALKGNAVWKAQPFVEEKRIVRLTDGFWPFGGVPSTTRFVERLVTGLTA